MKEIVRVTMKIKSECDYKKILCNLEQSNELLENCQNYVTITFY